MCMVFPTETAQAAKIWSVPPNRPPSLIFDYTMSPRVFPPNILPHFSLNFDFFLPQNCIRKLYFMLQTSKFAVILVWGGILGLSWQFFQVPLIWFHPWHKSPPPFWLHPWREPKIATKGKPPTKNLGEKTLICFYVRYVLKEFF